MAYHGPGGSHVRTLRETSALMPSLSARNAGMVPTQKKGASAAYGRPGKSAEQIPHTATIPLATRLGAHTLCRRFQWGVLPGPWRSASMSSCSEARRATACAVHSRKLPRQESFSA